MPTQYPYPEPGWSTGKMAKIGPMRGGDPGREFRELESVKRRKESQASELTPEQWQNWQRDFPQGQIIERDHPQLAELQQTHDFYEIPHQYEKYLFMNPKQQQAAGPGPQVG